MVNAKVLTLIIIAVHINNSKTKNVLFLIHEPLSKINVYARKS